MIVNLVKCFYIHFVLYNWIVANISNENKCVKLENTPVKEILRRLTGEIFFTVLEW